MSRASLAHIWMLVLVTACGGGSGGGSAPPPPAETSPPEDPSPPATREFRLSGSVTASGSQAVDGDTNDPNTPVRANNTAESAQSLPNPVTLGGYVNLPGEGEAGRSREAGDREDFYAVELLAGQSATLLVADSDTADADLYLYNGAGDIVDFSIETGAVESVTIEERGEYLINVSAFSGATSYTLVVGESAPANAPLRAEFVPGEIILDYDDNPALTVTLEPDLAWHMGMRPVAGGPDRARLLTLEASLAQQRRLGREAPRLQQFTDPEKRDRWETLLTIKRLASTPGVRLAEPNYRLRAAREPNDRGYPRQWHYPLINLPAAWATTTGSPEVIVAVVDSGILAGHPDLAGQLVPGYDFIRDPGRAGDGNGIDPNPEDTGERDNPGASGFHGTHVAGTIAARTDNTTGVAGVAWRSRIMPLRALGGESGTSYDIAQAVRYAAGLPNDSGRLPQRPADIINLSLSGEGFSNISQQLYRQLRDRGILIVAAAGNQGSTAPAYPAAYEGVLSVSAVDGQRRLASYSNRGSTIDLAAPGGDSSADINGDGFPDGVLSLGASLEGNGFEYGYYFTSGTSMAAPHVSGVLALMKALNPGLDHDTVMALLREGQMTDDAGAAGRDNHFGYGVLNAGRATQAAREGPGQAFAELTASSLQLNFGTGASRLDLFLGKRGSAPLQILDVSSNENWLAVAADSVDASGLGRYHLLLDRARLPAGISEASVTARSTSNTVVVRVLATRDSGITADVGTLYLLVYDPDTEEAVKQAVLRNQDGNYPFQLSEVPEGSYRIYVGSDADNDLFICDPGEACGAWLTLDQPATLELQGNRSDIRFSVDFQVNLPELQTEDGPARASPGLRRIDTGQGPDVEG